MVIFSSILAPGRVKGSQNSVFKLAIVLTIDIQTPFDFSKTDNRPVKLQNHHKLWHRYDTRTAAQLLNFDLSMLTVKRNIDPAIVVVYLRVLSRSPLLR